MQRYNKNCIYANFFSIFDIRFSIFEKRSPEGLLFLGVWCTVYGVGCTVYGLFHFLAGDGVNVVAAEDVEDSGTDDLFGYR